MGNAMGMRALLPLLLAAALPLSAAAAEPQHAPGERAGVPIRSYPAEQGLALQCGGLAVMQGIGKVVPVESARLLPGGLWELTLPDAGRVAYYRQDSGEFCFVDKAPAG